MAGTWKSSPLPPQQRGAGDGPFRRRHKDVQQRSALSVHTAPPPPAVVVDEPPAGPDPLAILREQIQDGSGPDAQDVAVTRRLIATRASEVRWAQRFAAAGWLIAVALAAVVVGFGLVTRSARRTIGRQQSQIDTSRQHAARLTQRLVDGEAHIQTMRSEVERGERRLGAARAVRRDMLDEQLAAEKRTHYAVTKLQYRLKSAAEARVAAVRAQLDVSLASAPVPTPAEPPGSNTPPRDDGSSP